MSSAGHGFGYMVQGMGLINKPGVKRFVIVPLLINIIIFITLIMVAGGYVTDLIKEYTPDLPDWLSWLRVALEVIYYLLALLIMFYTFSFVANLVGAPLNGFLAAAVEKHLTGKEPPGSDRNIMAELGVIILSELKKWLYYFMIAIPLIILSGILLFIFPPLIAVIWFLFGSWMFSLEYSDYPMGNYGLTFSQIRKTVSSKRMMTLGFGAAVTLGTMIPILNFIVMPVAVAGATAMRVKEFPISLENKN